MLVYCRRNTENKSMQLKNISSQGVNLVPKLATKTGLGTNIAAVEPYHHIPAVKNSSNQFMSSKQDVQQIQQRVQLGGNVHRKGDQQHMTNTCGDSTVSQQRNHYAYPLQNQKDALKISSTNDDHRIPTFGSSHDDERKSSISNMNGHTSVERVPDFWPNKFDSKYQTLPSGTKYVPISSNVISNGVSRYDYRRPAEGIDNAVPNNHDSVTNQKFSASADKRLSEDGFNNNIKEGGGIDPSESGNIKGDSTKVTSNTTSMASNNQQLLHQMNIVRSMPIQSISNKGLATSLPNSNYGARSTALNTNTIPAR